MACPDHECKQKQKQKSLGVKCTDEQGLRAEVARGPDLRIQNTLMGDMERTLCSFQPLEAVCPSRVEHFPCRI
jgi:hypothetical protein